MTTIAWDGKTLAADKVAIAGNLKHTTTKLLRHKDMRMGVAGILYAGMDLFEWAKNGFDPETYPESAKDDEGGTFLLAIKDGEEGKVIVYEGVATPVYFEDKFFAIGSGSHIATAAMYLGKSAEEAIEIAGILSNGSGQGVDYLD